MEILQEEHSILTGMKEEYPKKFTYKWTIQHFHKLNLCTGRSITSPLFRTSNSQHYLRIFPSGMYDANFVSITLEQVDKNAIPANIDFFILSDSMKLVNKARAERLNNNSFKCEKFISIDDLRDDADRLMNDNNLTVVCIFTINQTADRISSDTENDCQKYKNKISLFSDLEKLLQNKSSMDIALIANDKTVVFAHKLILTARSPVFAEMLERDMEETIQSDIEIKDFGSEVLFEMIQFMYTEKITNIKKHFCELLCLANKYNIEGLKNTCEELILRELSIDNVIEVFMFTESQNYSKIKQEALKFIVQNAPTIIKTEPFEIWKKDLPPLLVEILEAIT